MPMRSAGNSLSNSFIGHSHSHFRSLLLLSALALAGCLEDKERPKSYPGDVRGRVTLSGDPLRSGTVTFIPEQSENEGGRPGIARIEADGTYWIGNANPEKPPGLKPGRYRITVLSMCADPSGKGRPLAELVTPERYADETTTPFHAEVVEGVNKIDIHLTE